MAFAAVRAVFERSGATRLRLLTLLCLAEYVSQDALEHDYDWAAWPSQATLAHRLNCTDRQVRDALQQLVDDGELERTFRRKNGAWVYVLRLPDEKPAPEAIPGRKLSDEQMAERKRRAERKEPSTRKKPSTRKEPSARKKRVPERKKSSGAPGRNLPTNQKRTVSKNRVGPAGPTPSSRPKIIENGKGEIEPEGMAALLARRGGA